MVAVRSSSPTRSHSSQMTLTRSFFVGNSSSSISGCPDCRSAFNSSTNRSTRLPTARRGISWNPLRFRGMVLSLQVIRINQKPFGRFPDLSHLVQVGSVLVVAKRLSPVLPDALPTPLNLYGEGGFVNRGGSQGPYP